MLISVHCTLGYRMGRLFCPWELLHFLALAVWSGKNIFLHTKKSYSHFLFPCLAWPCLGLISFQPTPHFTRLYDWFWITSSVLLLPWFNLTPHFLSRYSVHCQPPLLTWPSLHRPHIFLSLPLLSPLHLFLLTYFLLNPSCIPLSSLLSSYSWNFNPHSFIFPAYFLSFICISSWLPSIPFSYTFVHPPFSCPFSAPFLYAPFSHPLPLSHPSSFRLCLSTLPYSTVSSYFFLCSHLYCTSPPLLCCIFPLLASLCIFIFVFVLSLLLFLFPSQAMFGELSWPVTILTIFYSLAGLGIAIVNDFKSIEGDT